MSVARARAIVRRRTSTRNGRRPTSARCWFRRATTWRAAPALAAVSAGGPALPGRAAGGSRETSFRARAAGAASSGAGATRSAAEASRQDHVAYMAATARKATIAVRASDSTPSTDVLTAAAGARRKPGREGQRRQDRRGRHHRGQVADGGRDEGQLREARLGEGQRRGRGDDGQPDPAGPRRDAPRGAGRAAGPVLARAGAPR